MKKINSSSLLISISFILILSLITSIFLISFQNNVNIENKKVENIKTFNEEENQIKYYENSMNRNFYNKFELGNYVFESAVRIGNPYGSNLNYSIVDLNGDFNKSIILKISKEDFIENNKNTYYQISTITNLSNKFNINIKHKTICNNVDNLSLKELLNNEDCFTNDWKTKAALTFYQGTTNGAAGGWSAGDFRLLTIFQTRYKNFKIDQKKYGINLKRKNSYSKSFIRTWFKIIEEIDYEDHNLQNCFWKKEIFGKEYLDIKCLKDYIDSI